MSTINLNDWPALVGSSPFPEADEFHYRRKHGATVHSVGWQQMSKKMPTRDQAWWSIYEAHAWLAAYSSDRYSRETLLVSHAQMVHRIASKVLDTVRSDSWRDSFVGRKDLGGADLFSVGLEAVLKVLIALPMFGPVCDDDPNDPDELRQLSRYLARAAQNAMFDFQKKTSKGIRSSRVDGELEDEDGNLPTDDYGPDKEVIESESIDRVRTALIEVCTDEHDQRLLEMKEKGTLTEAEMGAEVGMSRDQVNRRIHCILESVEDRLGLEHKPMKKRKKRKSSGSDA